MNRKEGDLLRGIYADCLRLKRAGELTEFGEGQLVLCRMLLWK